MRDALSTIADGLVLSVGIGAPFNKKAFALPALTLGAIDRRVELEGTLTEQRLRYQDAYATRRDLYLQARAKEIEALHTSHARDVILSPSGAGQPRQEPHEVHPGGVDSGTASPRTSENIEKSIVRVQIFSTCEPIHARMGLTRRMMISI